MQVFQERSNNYTEHCRYNIVLCMYQCASGVPYMSAFAAVVTKDPGATGVRRSVHYYSVKLTRFFEFSTIPVRHYFIRS